MESIRLLEPRDVWGFFADICAIPHPSGHLKPLADALAARAASQGLSVQRDEAGNLRIDRPAAAGKERSPEIILQGHLDMVPQSAPGKIFDFTAEPIRTRIENGEVRADGTTLGADNGIGVAFAMAMLFDRTLECGPLSALLTVDEEIGLIGAGKLSAPFLQGDVLINLDSGPDDLFTIGCAGGTELFFAAPLRMVPAPAGNGFRISVRGLRGGHSGMEIARRRGNAHIFLARFLRTLPLSVASFSGGSVANAISRESKAAVCTSLSLESLRQSAALFADELKKEFDAPEGFGFDVESESAPCEVWDGEFQRRWLAAVATVPDAVIRFDDRLQVPGLSSNFAIVRQEGNELQWVLHPRGFSEEENEALNRKLQDHFASVSRRGEIRGGYPGWRPDFNSRLLNTALAVRKRLFGDEAKVKAIHAGLECGLFKRLNPHLDIIAFGPEMAKIHTPEETLNIASVAKFDRFLRELIREV